MISSSTTALADYARRFLPPLRPAFRPKQAAKFLARRLSDAYDSFLKTAPTNSYAVMDEQGWRLSADSSERLDKGSTRSTDQSQILAGQEHAPRQESLLPRQPRPRPHLQDRVYLQYLSEPELRGRIRRGLFKVEQIHALARDVFYGRQGRINAREPWEQMNTCRCLTLILALHRLLAGAGNLSGPQSV